MSNGPEKSSLFFDKLGKRKGHGEPLVVRLRCLGRVWRAEMRRMMGRFKKRRRVENRRVERIEKIIREHEELFEKSKQENPEVHKLMNEQGELMEEIGDLRQELMDMFHEYLRSEKA